MERLFGTGPMRQPLRRIAIPRMLSSSTPRSRGHRGDLASTCRATVPIAPVPASGREPPFCCRGRRTRQSRNRTRHLVCRIAIAAWTKRSRLPPLLGPGGQLAETLGGFVQFIAFLTFLPRRLIETRDHVENLLCNFFPRHGWRPFGGWGAGCFEFMYPSTRSSKSWSKHPSM